jgi:homogentisate 1,2-dioxygenase
MIDRHRAGLLPQKPHTVYRAPDGQLLYEELLTRGGFGGAFSYFYHRFPVGAHRDAGVSHRGWPAPEVDPAGPHSLRRRLYLSDRVAPLGMLVDRRLPILFNEDVTVLVAHAVATDDVYFANGDGDELWFLRDGRARVESPCGWLDVKAGDYVWIPKAMIHRWHVKEGPVRMLCFETRGGVSIPSALRNAVGQLRMDAPYTHRDFERPVGPIATLESPLEGPRELIVKRQGVFTRYTFDTPPMDVVGWDGFVYPFAFAIEKYQAKTGLVHLPPTIHATFAGPGFLVCSFVPRVTDTHPEAIPCPYPHSSVDCDEVILYLRGNFTSRPGVGPGAISLHPAGIAHGPHPGAYEASIGATRTDELAVMCDTWKPLAPTPQAANLEDRGYHESWIPGRERATRGGDP